MNIYSNVVILYIIGIHRHKTGLNYIWYATWELRRQIGLFFVVSATTYDLQTVKTVKERYRDPRYRLHLVLLVSVRVRLVCLLLCPDRVRVSNQDGVEKGYAPSTGKCLP